MIVTLSGQLSESGSESGLGNKREGQDGHWHQNEGEMSQGKTEMELN